MMEAVSYFATFHSRPFSREAVIGRLPVGIADDPAEIAKRMLDVVGLKAQVSQRRLGQIDAGSLPILLFRGPSPIVLTALDKERGEAEILDPVAQSLTELRLDDLQSQIKRDVLLVAPKEAVTASRLSPEARQINTDHQHWLWSELKKHKSAWFQVTLAALGINLAGLALPIFVMNVFDRVIPNLAFVTLTTLTIGVCLASALDLLLRLLRSAIIQRVSRRTDLAVASNLFSIALRQRLLARDGGSAGAITNLRDFETLRDFFTSSTLVAFIDLIFIGIFLFVLAMIVGPLAWIPIMAIPTILILAVIAKIPISRAARQTQQMNIKRNVVLIETLNGLETIKSVGAEPIVQREWENAMAASSRVAAKTRNWSNFTGSATIFVQQLVSAGIICWGVFLVSKGSISLGALVAANILVRAHPLASHGHHANDFQSEFRALVAQVHQCFRKDRSGTAEHIAQRARGSARVHKVGARQLHVPRGTSRRAGEHLAAIRAWPDNGLAGPDRIGQFHIGQTSEWHLCGRRRHDPRRWI